MSVFRRVSTKKQQDLRWICFVFFSKNGVEVDLSSDHFTSPPSGWVFVGDPMGFINLWWENTQAIGISGFLAEESPWEMEHGFDLFDFVGVVFVIGNFFGNIFGCDVAMRIFYL